MFLSDSALYDTRVLQNMLCPPTDHDSGPSSQRPLADHDPFTRQFFGLLEDDLEQLANGGSLSERLGEEVRRLNICPLDESTGEGYHRSTHHEKRRAEASNAAHLKAATRLKENVARVRGFIREHGAPGKRVVRWEWRHWKRVIQTQKKKRHRNTKMKPLLVLSKRPRPNPERTFFKSNRNQKLTTQKPQTKIQKFKYYNSKMGFPNLSRWVSVPGV